MAYVRISPRSANFSAILTVMANPNASISVVGPKTYAGTANPDGVAVFKINKKGSYVVTSSVGVLYTETVSITEHTNYTVDVYKASASSVTLTSGTSWTVPRGVRSVTYFLVGGGAGGASALSGTGGGQGGQGGTTLTGTMNVTPLASISYEVGAGGGAGANGGNTTFGSYTAQGGAAGTASTSNNVGGGNSGGGGSLGNGSSSVRGKNGFAYGTTSGQGRSTREYESTSTSATPYSGGGGGGTAYSSDPRAIESKYPGNGGDGGGGKGAKYGWDLSPLDWNKAVAGTPGTGGGGGGGATSSESGYGPAAGGSGRIMIKWS